MTARSAALILAVAVVAALCLCLVAPAEGSGAFGRQRRSVNFTPSWGKRSGEEAAVEVAVGAHDECGDPTRGRRIDLLVQRIKVWWERFFL